MLSGVCTFLGIAELRRPEMATVEMSREYPVDTAELYEFCTDVRNWPSCYDNMIDATGGKVQERGDTATSSYRLLGRTIEVNVEAAEATPGERIVLIAHTAHLPDVEHDWRYTPTADGTRVDVRLHVPEVESWLGRTLDRLVIPRQLEKDLARSLDNLEALAQAGLTSEPA